jgi:hypothetical protein
VIDDIFGFLLFLLSGMYDFNNAALHTTGEAGIDKCHFSPKLIIFFSVDPF